MFCRYEASSVAVKIIQQGSTTEEYSRRREKFLREIMMLSRVQHENLVKVFFFLLCFVLFYFTVFFLLVFRDSLFGFSVVCYFKHLIKLLFNIL